MNPKLCSIKILVVFSVVFVWTLSAAAMDEPLFSISRMVIAHDIANKEPVTVSEEINVGNKIVYCFLEALNIETDTEVSFIWYFEKKEQAKVTLQLKQGKRWRTFASKNIINRKGNWTVDLQDESGIVLNTVAFTVE